MKKIPDSVQKFYELNKINGETFTNDTSFFPDDDTTSASGDASVMATPRNQVLSKLFTPKSEKNAPVLDEAQMEQIISQAAEEDAKT